jgi:hypothetical protein
MFIFVPLAGIKAGGAYFLSNILLLLSLIQRIIKKEGLNERRIN